MVALTGLGAWIWQISQCDKGNFQQTVQRCQAAGVKWIGIKMGDSDAYSYFTPAKIQELKSICNNAGISLGGWNYSLPTTTSRQIIQVNNLINSGVEFWVIDAETEWEFQAGNDALAEQFLSNLRTKIGAEVALGYAPFGIIEYHSAYPYTMFSKYCNYAMPQLYWTQFNWSAAYTLQLADASWKKFFGYHPDISPTSYCPIMASYGSEYPGVKGTLTASDIKLFFDHYKNQTNISFYSVDAANQTFWNTVNEIAQTPALTPGDDFNKEVDLISGPATVTTPSIADIKQTVTNVEQHFNISQVFNIGKNFYTNLKNKFNL